MPTPITNTLNTNGMKNPFASLFGRSNSLGKPPNTSTNKGSVANYAPPKMVSSGVSGVVSPLAPTIPTKKATTNIMASSGGIGNQPITGNTTTPSGAIINASSGGLIAPPPTSQVSQGTSTAQGQFNTSAKGLFPNVASSLANRANQTSPVFNQGIDRYNDISERIAEIGQKGARATAGYLTTGTTPVAEGNAAVIAKTTALQQQALGEQQKAALTSAGLGQEQQKIQQGALTSVAGLAPEATRYDAFTSDGSGGTFNPTTTANNYAREVISGARTYDDASNAMGLYGSAGKQFLDNAIRQANPNFNFSQAQSLADIQGKIGPQFDFAKSALSSVENALSTLSGSQTTNVPLWNRFANFASLQSGIGSEATRQFVGAVQSLRNAYATVLASARGGTPTDYSSQAIAEIPDIPTPNDLAAIRHNLETLGQARIGIYGTPGSNPTQGETQNGNSLYSW